MSSQYERWTPEEDAKLRAAWGDPSRTGSQIAAVIGRSERAVFGRARWLGLVKAPAWAKHGSGWTEERVERLKLMVKEGLSASEIARQLGGVTRNAVIGKAVRLNLGPIGGGKASAPMRARVQMAPRAVAPPKPRPVKQPIPKGVMVLTPLTGGDVATQARLDNMEARANPPENVRLLARAFTPLPGREPVAFGSRGCKWPCGGDGAEMLQCGCERVEGGPYCEAHAAVAFKPVPPKQKTGNDLARSLRRYTENGRVAA